MTRRLDDAVLADVDRRLSAADAQLVNQYPGDDGRRQPVHTVYVPGNRYSATTPADWGATALATAKEAGGLDGFVHATADDEKALWPALRRFFASDRVEEVVR